MRAKTVSYEDAKAQLLNDPATRKAYEELQPACQLTRLRLIRGLTQEQLAERVGTKQPSIARLESGEMAPRLSFLRQVVEALDGRLIISIEPKEDSKNDDGQDKDNMANPSAHSDETAKPLADIIEDLFSSLNMNKAATEKQGK
jgi:transcriptional regulator with XRE-family HTH domain